MPESQRTDEEDIDMKSVKTLEPYEVAIFSALAVLVVALSGLLFAVGFQGQVLV
jgi:hypothetical protein